LAFFKEGKRAYFGKVSFGKIWGGEFLGHYCGAHFLISFPRKVVPEGIVVKPWWKVGTSF